MSAAERLWAMREEAKAIERCRRLLSVRELVVRDDYARAAIARLTEHLGPSGYLAT